MKPTWNFRAEGLITPTPGAMSAESTARAAISIIKPSGVDYDALSPDDMVVMDLDGNKIEGRYKPSSDTATHIELYKKYEEIGGIVHTHSRRLSRGRRRAETFRFTAQRMQTISSTDSVRQKSDAGGDRRGI